MFLSGVEIDRALRRAVHAELLRHKKLGNSIVVVRDGQIVHLAPDEIDLSDEAE